MKKNIDDTRRAERRYAINIKVVLDDDSAYRIGRAVDASRRGLCVVAGLPFDVGRLVRLIPLSESLLSITHAADFELQGEVMWTAEDVLRPADSDERFIAGVRLLDCDNAAISCNGLCEPSVARLSA